MPVGFTHHLINIDLFTDAYRVTGQAEVGSGGIQAELSNPNTDYLELADAYISRIHQPGDIVSSYGQCGFRKENINFIILQDRRDGVSVGTTHGRSIFTRGRPLSIFLAVPAFEISGTVLHEGAANPSMVLIQSPGRFQAVFEASASAALYPDLSYSGDLILVQKDRVAICGLNTSTR